MAVDPDRDAFGVVVGQVPAARDVIALYGAVGRGNFINDVLELAGAVARTTIIKSQAGDTVPGERARQFHVHAVRFDLRARESMQQQRGREPSPALGRMQHADDLLTFALEDNWCFHGSAV